VDKAVEGIVSKHCKACDYTFHSIDDFTKYGSGFRQCTSGFLWFECKCGSTLMLKKGCYDWYDPVMFLAPTSVPFFRDEKILENFPHLPTSLMKLQQVIREPSSSARDIALFLKRVPLIAAEVLRLSNNCRPGKNTITSIEHAVAYLGRSAVSQLTLASALQTYRFKTSFYQLEKFWREAFLTGMVAQLLGEKFTALKNVDQIYLAGTLCNIGKLISAICYPEETDEIEKTLTDPQTMTTWSEAENDLKAVSHVNLGDIASVIWGLPLEIRQSILYHHKKVTRKSGLTPALRPHECVGLATLLCHWISSEPHRIDKDLLESYKSFLRLGESDLETLVNSLLPLSKIVEIQLQQSELIN